MVSAGGHPCQHPLHHHLRQHVVDGEVGVAGQRHLVPVDGACPGPINRHPAPTQGHRSLPGAVDPPLILADEPTAHLDHVQTEGVLRLLRELASGERIVVVATHDTRIMPFADRVVRLPDFSAIDSEPETVRVASGSVLFEQGSMGDLICVVVDGELEVVRESADGMTTAIPGMQRY
jgi:hypothetical protein